MILPRLKTAFVAISIIAIIGGCSSTSKTHEGAKASTFQIRAATPNDDTNKSDPLESVDVSGQSWRPGDVIVTASDVQRARIGKGPSDSDSIWLDFDAAGSERLHAATRDSIGKPILIYVNGTLVDAPIVHSPIRMAIIAGTLSPLSKVELERLVSQLNASKAGTVDASR